MTLHIGCGSWADSAYTGVLYPTGLPARERLRVYAQSFNHVEVNATYYATPLEAVTAGWVAQTPPGFTFNVKLHRAFSLNPQKTARDGKLVTRLLEGVGPLIAEGRLGTFLLVLAPSFRPERNTLSELDELVDRLRPHVLAVELRHRDWISSDQRTATLAYFRQQKIAWVAVDMPPLDDNAVMPPLDAVTRPDLAYLRLHGRNLGYVAAGSAAERHCYLYPERELEEIVERVHALAATAENVHVIANNHANDFAPKTALALRGMLAATERDPTSTQSARPPVRRSILASAVETKKSRSTLCSNVNPNQGNKMAKSQNSKKETKKAPLKSAKEKKQAKRDKKG